MNEKHVAWVTVTVNSHDYTFCPMGCGFMNSRSYFVSPTPMASALNFVVEKVNEGNRVTIEAHYVSSNNFANTLNRN